MSCFDDGGAVFSLVLDCRRVPWSRLLPRARRVTRETSRVDGGLTAFGQVARHDGGGELRGVLHERLAVTVDDEAARGR